MVSIDSLNKKKLVQRDIPFSIQTLLIPRGSPRGGMIAVEIDWYIKVHLHTAF